VRRRSRLLLLILLIVPLGLGTLVYRGPGADWTEGYGGAICYEVFWVLAWKGILPYLRVRDVAAGVFVATCALELLQLSRHPWFEWIRSFYLGRVFFGAVFDPLDFLYYALGSAAAVVLYQAVVETETAASLPGGSLL
jgi:hypothetical protein